jgi:hypothetical protein
MTLSIGATHLMRELVDVKRSPPIVGGKRGDPILHLQDVPSTSLLPVDPEIIARFGTEGPVELLQHFVPGEYDIREGDFVVYSGREYSVKGASEWHLGKKSLNHLIIEDRKSV